MYDYHVHTTYSDGHLLPMMVEAAESAGLDGIGLADHCTVSSRDSREQYRRTYGFNLDRTYDRRREAIEELQETVDIEIFDGVEMDYHPADESAIEDFLQEADFEYAIGSVHEVDENNVHFEYFATLSASEKENAVDTYFENLVKLIESDLFDIVAHPDLFERNTALRGLATEDHYEAVAGALETHDTVVELNAGRVRDDYGEFHPSTPFREVLSDHGVDIVPGSDAHEPAEVTERAPLLEEAFSSIRGPATLECI